MWESEFDISGVARDLKCVDTVVHNFLKTCCALQQSAMKELTITPTVSQKTPEISIAAPDSLPPPPTVPVLKAGSLIPSRPQTSLLVPKVERVELIDNSFLLSTKPPDQVCHKRAFSSSVIRIPYLVFDRVVDHDIRVKADKKVQTKPQPKSTRPSKGSKNTSGHTSRLTPSTKVTRPSLRKYIKLEAPEVFVGSDSGYQYVSRPEFSDDETSLVITISSDSN